MLRTGIRNTLKRKRNDSEEGKSNLIFTLADWIDEKSGDLEKVGKMASLPQENETNLACKNI